MRITENLKYLYERLKYLKYEKKKCFFVNCFIFLTVLLST